MQTCLPSRFLVRRLLANLASALPVALLSLAAPASAQVIISQIYGGGGNSGAPYTHDFVELCNNGSATVDLAGWTLQYASATGTSWSATNLSGSVPPGGYFFVRLGSQANVGSALPGTPNIIGSTNIAGGAGKLALVNNTTALTGACPSPLPGSVKDLVGYGTTASCFEGGTRAPAPSNTTAIIRNASCGDSNVNGTDFTVTNSFAPRNTSAPAPAPAPAPPPPAPTAALICTIQGSGATSPLVGQSVITSGVVTKVNGDGFFIQHQDCDNNTTSSDGIFVFTGSTTYPAAAPGSAVQVTGTVSEYNPGTTGNLDTSTRPMTQISSVSAVTVTGSMPSVTPVDLSLPLAVGDSVERFEGMLVRITSTMTVQQNYFQARFGQLTLGAGGRHETPTNKHPAGSPAAIDMAALQARSRLLLDDGSSTQNPSPTPYIGTNGLPRGGDTIASITGVIDFGLATSSTSGLGLYRIHPTVAPTIVASHPRPLAPAAVGGNLKLGAMNVLNYFTTFTDGRSDGNSSTGQGCRIGGVGGSTSAGNCRGASNQAEFDRQRAKIVRALAGLNADAVGLMEIQNNGNVATQSLVSALNAHVGAGTYSVVSDPAGTDPMGTDAIKVAMIYKPARLTPVAAPVTDTAAINNRATLAQTFAAANGERFSLVVNHLKSKGSCPSGSGADADQGDGQGCWNNTRVLQANQLRTFVGQLQTNSGSNDVLLVGDFNANGQEDPILNLTGSGYVDQMVRFSPSSPAYSYVFDGTVGRLDHGISSATMSAKFTGASYWHINADESLAQDYNLESKQPACAACAPDPYSVNPYRSSDHDPLLLGLDLYKSIVASPSSTSLVGTAGDDILYCGAGRRSLTGGAGRDWFVFSAGFAGGATITDFEPGVDAISLRALMQSLGITSADPIGQGYVSCVASGLDAVIRVDPDAAGPAAPRAMLLLKQQGCSVLTYGNFAF